MQFIDLQRQYRAYQEKIDQQIKEVLDSSHYVLGAKVSELESRLAEFAGTQYAVGVSSGTDALLMALMAKGVKPGDEIITSPFTFFATAEVISFLGAKPVFADIQEDTYNIASRVHDLTVKIRPKDKMKTSLVIDMVNKYVDIDEIVKSL